MIELLFPRYWPRYVADPCGMLVRDFANWIVQRGYTRSCAKGHVRRFHAVLTTTGVEIGPRQPIPSVALARCFAPWADNPWYRGTHAAAKRFLAARRLLISRVKAKPFDSLIAAYRSYLLDQRGLAVPTGQATFANCRSFSGKRLCPNTRSRLAITRRYRTLRRPHEQKP
jgi:integrase/recombinase XerD